jgi:hypothetical protein
MFGVVSENTNENNGTTDSQTYYNITLTLRYPDPDFGSTSFKTSSVYMNTARTTDGGKTWLIPYMMILPMAKKTPAA